MRAITITLTEDDLEIIMEALDWHLLKSIHRCADADRINDTQTKICKLIPDEWGWAGEC